VDGDGEADAKLINLLQPGGQREIYNNEDKAPDIMDGTDTYLDSTWFEGEYRNSSGEVDAEASVTGLEHTDVLSVYQYTIPNPTEIPTEDIKQIETTPVSGDLGNEPTPNPRSNKGDVLYDESFHPVWTQVHESELSGVSNSETFTWTLRPQPSVDLSIDSVQSGAGEIDDPEITVTARSATPVINSRIFIHTTGPNIEGNTTRQQFDPSNHLSENPNTLVTPEYGDERIGASRTIRMRFEHITDADFPLSDEDRIIVGVDSKLGSSAYPIAMSERSLPEVIQ